MDDNNVKLSLPLPCENCNRVRPLNFCELHENYTCHRCKCVECMTPEEEILYLEKKINSLYSTIHSYEYDLRMLRKSLNTP